MISAFESLLPVFLLIALGWALKAWVLPKEEMWRGLEALGYWVFFPALIGATLIPADIRSLDLTAIALTMIAAFLTMAACVLLFKPVLKDKLGLDGPGYSSLFQCATRWNGFVALPILAKLYGDDGVTLVAVIIGALVPLANVMAVTVVARNTSARSPSIPETVRIVFRNPFIWATALSILVNLAGIPVYAPVLTSLDLLGGAAMGAGLLMVGAGLSADGIFRPSAAVLTGTALKLIGTPLLVLGWSLATGVTGMAFVACMVCAAVPTATSAYVLARQMGGDGPLVSATVMLQTLVSFFSIPLVIMLAQALQ